jgi:predicted Zn-ribbon and HTH transcriptional regulator
MTRPAIEVADILRAQGNRFLERYQSSFSYQQLKAFRAIVRCRTAALGGHIDQCHGCGYEAGISSNWCRSRCCPKCQAQARQRWIEAQQRDLLNTGYCHVVFTVSHELNVFALTTPAAFHDLLFSASSQTLLEVAADSKWLGAEIGFLAISTVSFPPEACLRTISAGSTLAIHASCSPFRCCARSSATSSSLESNSFTEKACSTAAVRRGFS